MDLQRIILNCALYIAHFLKIRDKEGRVIPFRLNKPQQRLYDAIRSQWKAGKPVRVIILKARQMGFSTLTEAIIFWMAATAFNVECMIVAHTSEATQNLFQMSKRFYDHLHTRSNHCRKHPTDRNWCSADLHGTKARIRD